MDCFIKCKILPRNVQEFRENTKETKLVKNDFLELKTV
jgi:hypothetical protein